VYATEPVQTVLIAVALLLVSIVTVQLAPWAETFFDEKDSGKFVTDEVAGFLLTVLLFRTSMLFSNANPWMTVLWAFPITRIIDIIKIPPAKRLEKWPAGWGVLADDLLGSVYAAALLHVLAFAFPHWFS
jgi:phosphatidylglycerophosphatase A